MADLRIERYGLPTVLSEQLLGVCVAIEADIVVKTECTSPVARVAVIQILEVFAQGIRDTLDAAEEKPDGEATH